MVLLAEQSPRVIAALAIALAHALAVYGLLVLKPQPAAALTPRPVEVQFLNADDPAPPAWRPPTVPIAAPDVSTPQPDLPAIQTEALLSRAITVPVRVAPAPASTAGPSPPKLISVVQYLREPSPRYPPQSRRLREEGVVVLRVVIDEHGQASDIAIESSSGYERLDRAAREAVASAAFRPYVEDGAPRRAQVLIPIEFSLNRRTA
jgi:periplasmic protein TonB